MTRLNARNVDIPKFIAEHGKEVCDEMFAALQARDKKKAKR